MADAAERHGPRLLALAARAILEGLGQGEPTPPRLEAEPPPLRAEGASFVTLTRAADGALRGCIGSPQAWRPLAVDVVANAWAAASRDPRFPPVEARDLSGLALSISLLTAPVPLPFIDQADLLARMRPGIDGLILKDHGRRGLFLPQVWESLPEPARFLAHLKQKAGFPADHWSDTLSIDRFEARSVKSASLPDPGALWRREEV